jgi:hypothetical protein
MMIRRRRLKCEVARLWYYPTPWPAPDPGAARPIRPAPPHFPAPPFAKCFSRGSLGSLGFVESPRFSLSGAEVRSVRDSNPEPKNLGPVGLPATLFREAKKRKAKAGIRRVLSALKWKGVAWESNPGCLAGGRGSVSLGPCQEGRGPLSTMLGSNGQCLLPICGSRFTIFCRFRSHSPTASGRAHRCFVLPRTRRFILCIVSLYSINSVSRIPKTQELA